jgi:hypothetical protein
MLRQTFPMKKKSIILFLLALTIFACRKEHSKQQPPPIIVPPPITGNQGILITVDKSQPGYKLSSNFEGLSFENQILATNPDFLNENNKVLVQMIKNLGGGILRMGGGTSDEVFWAINTNSTVATDSICRADIDRLAAFSKAINWPVIFGLNLGDNNVAAAANEAVYVHNSLGSNLYFFQSGNEPDVFYYGLRPSIYGYGDYQKDWENYLSGVRLKVPGAPFAGPDVAYNSTWITSFAENESTNAGLIDGHFYTTGPATDPTITYHTILAHSTKLTDYLGPIKYEADKFKLPYRITESNNVYGGGKQGVSDVFASTLWALDMMWTVAEYNGAGVNFHDGVGLYYSPIAIKNGAPVAGAEYYAMLAFKYAAEGGTVFPVIMDKINLCSAYAAVKPDKSYSITIINKDDATDHLFNIPLANPAAQVQLTRLMAPSITSADIKFAGATVNKDGSFMPQAPEQYIVNSGNYVVDVPAGSALIVNVK